MEVQIDAVSAALRDAHGHGLTLKQLAGQLHLGQAARQPLRRALQQLLGEGQATFDGHRYRFRPAAARRDGDGRAQQRHGDDRGNGRDAGKVASRRSQAPTRTASRQPTAAGQSATGVLHLKPEGYGFVSPLLGGSGRQDDVFVPPRRNRGALDGDVVRVKIERGRDGRRDLRELPLVTIDGEDARDFDDAVHVSRVGEGGYRLVVAIADVAHYVKPGGALDREALRRGTSVYFPSMVLPMLPERISNGICSLNPDVDRLCMVCDLALDSQGRPLHAEIYEGVMRSHARLTYTKVADALAGEPEADVRPLLEDLGVAHELAKKLTAQRRERGSIDF